MLEQDTDQSSRLFAWLSSEQTLATLLCGHALEPPLGECLAVVVPPPSWAAFFESL